MRVFLTISLCVAVLCAIVLASDMSHSAAATKTTDRSTEAASLQSTPEQHAKAEKCSNFLTKDRSGIWQHYQADGDTIAVVVGPVYYMADFGTKEALNGLIRCVGTDGRMDTSVAFIDYLDASTHHEAATWTPELGLEVK